MVRIIALLLLAPSLCFGFGTFPIQSDSNPVAAGESCTTSNDILLEAVGTVYAGRYTITSSDWKAQKVLTGAAWTVTSVTFLMRDNSATDNFIVRIYDDDSDKPGSVLGSITTAHTSIDPTPTSTHTFDFTTPVELSDATSYWFSVEADGSGNFSVDMANNPYADGYVRGTTDGGATWAQNNSSVDLILSIYGCE